MNLLFTILRLLFAFIVPWLEAICGVPFAADAAPARDYPPTGAQTIRSAVALPDGTVVLTDALDHEGLRRVFWSGSGSGDGIKTLPAPPDILGEAVGLTEEGWWYATGSNVDGVFGTTFLVGTLTGQVRSSFVPQSRTPMHFVLPLAGADARILHLSFSDGPDVSLQAVDTAVAGKKRTWQVPTPSNHVLSVDRHAAAVLPDGRIALVGLDIGSNEVGTLVLHVLGDEKEVVTTTLRSSVRASSVATAVDPDGRLAVVTTVGDRLDTLVVEGAIVDPATVGIPQWFTLSALGSFQQRVVSTTEGFVVAWLRRGDRGLIVEAREFGPQRAGLVTAEVGDASGSDGRDTFLTLQPAGDEVTFLWQNPAGRLARRSFPAAIDGQWAARRFFASLCDRLGERGAEWGEGEDRASSVGTAVACSACNTVDASHRTPPHQCAVSPLRSRNAFSTLEVRQAVAHDHGPRGTHTLSKGAEEVIEESTGRRKPAISPMTASNSS
jgi:hypothetical protein